MSRMQKCCSGGVLRRSIQITDYHEGSFPFLDLWPDGRAYLSLAWLAGAEGRRREAFHVRTPTGGGRRRPALPRQHRPGYAADLPHGLLAGDHARLQSHPFPGCALRPGPHPPGSSRFIAYGALPLVHSRCTSPSCLPDPSRLAVPTRPVVVGAACHLALCLQGQAAPSFWHPAATGRRWGLAPHPVGAASCCTWSSM